MSNINNQKSLRPSGSTATIKRSTALRPSGSTASNGFTMVELVLVVGVLVVLSAVVLVALKVPQYRGQAHNVQRKTNIEAIHNAFLLMARDKDDYTDGLPTSPACIGTGSANAFNLKGISWTANPSSTQMKFNVRACTNSTCSTNPSWGSDYSSPASIEIPNASFFQYKATFTDASESAWTQPTDEPFNGTTINTVVSGSGSVKLGIVGTGADGPIIINTTKNINTDIITLGRTYADGVAYKITAPADGVIAVTAAVAPNGIIAGDEVLILNMQGTNADYADVGNYEFKRVLSVSGSTINFTTAIIKSFDGATASNQKVVVQRVPNYTDVTVCASNNNPPDVGCIATGSITASAWDGLATTPTGSAGYYTGIVAFKAKGTVSVAGTITVNNKGFRGGPQITNSNGQQGESYVGLGISSTSANASGGGGGGVCASTAWQGGGGGAGYASIGETGRRGGYGGSDGVAGVGGAAFSNFNVAKLVLGSGGGGAGERTGVVDAMSGGGNGGGIIFISSLSTTVTGWIISQGLPAASCWAGSSSGGTIILRSQNNSNLGSTLVYANGGARGNCSNYNWGGAGSAGMIRVEQVDTVPIATTNPAASVASGGFHDYAGTYISLPHDLLGQSTFKSIAWNRTDTKDGEITLGDSALKGLWHINEGSGTNVKDSAGGNTGTMSGAGWGEPGKFGGHSFFSTNGTKNITTGGSPSGLDIGASDGSWTLEAWVKPTGTAAGTIISKDGAAMHYYDLKLNASNQVVAGLYDADGDQAVATSTMALSVGDWHHIAAVFTKSVSTGTVQIYIDGTKNGGLESNSALPSNMSNTAAFRIGQRNDGTLGFNGEIDEVAFWSKALTAPATDCTADGSLVSYDAYSSEICQHYNKGVGIPHLKFQARSCASSCTTEAFAGPDGTAATYYNSIGNYGSNSPLNLPANQWVQYKAYFATSDSSVTPSLDSISIKYSAIQISKPKLEDVTITASLDSAGKNQVNLLYSGYGDFVGGGTNLGQISPVNSLKILNDGSIEYQGGSNPEYTSPVFSTQCFDIAPVLVPEYLPEVPKDPKIGTDENTGYFFSANPEMGTVTVSAPAAELGEIIRN